MDKIKELAAADKFRIDKELCRAKEKVDALEGENDPDPATVERHREHLAVMSEISTLINRAEHDSLSGVLTTFKDLREHFEEDYKKWKLSTIACSYACRLLIQFFEGWDPLQNPSHGLKLMRTWRNFLRGDRPYDYSLYCMLLKEVVYPAVIKGTITWEAWNFSSMFLFVSKWKTVLRQPVFDLILENVVTQKLLQAVDLYEFDPQGDLLKNMIQYWVLQWNSILGKRLEPVHGLIYFKIKRTLTKFRRRQNRDMGAEIILKVIKKQFKTPTKMMVYYGGPHVIPLSQKVGINSWAKLEHVFEWYNFWKKYIPTKNIVKLLDFNFFTNLHELVERFMISNPDFEEVRHWYLSLRLYFPSKFLADDIIRMKLDETLAFMMNCILEAANGDVLFEETGEDNESDGSREVDIAIRDNAQRLYTSKLELISRADGELSAEDVSALGRLRILLCIPQQVIDAVHTDICGRLFEKVVKNVITSGVEGYDADVRASVRKASQGLYLTKDAALSIADKIVRKMFINYVQRSRSAGDHTESAKELKKMIAFNTLVVTELVSDIKGEPSTASAEPINVEPEPTDEEEDEFESLQTLRKAKPNKDLQEKLGKQGQTEITLKDDLPLRDRADLYRTYLLFCLSGEVTTKDNTEFLMLNQLGGILGLNGKEIVDIHKNLVEQAFTKQAEVILADGQLTKARIEQLNEAQKQVGLPPEHAQKIIKNITTTKLANAIETAIGQGRIGIQQVRELREAGVDLDNIISERLRENLFKKTVEQIFSSGTGVFDDEEVYQKIPAELSIDAEEAKGVVRDIAESRLSNSLVQAVALLRQRNRDGVISALNDMLVCDMAVPAEQPLKWSSPEELADLYCVYLKGISRPEKLLRLQKLLGISDAAAEMLRDNAERGQLSVEDEEEEFVF